MPKSPRRTTATRRKHESGVALITVLFFLLLVSGLAMAMMYGAKTETAINDNYRDSVQAAFAARAGLEEVRDRLRSAHPNPISPPGLMPGVPNSIIYLRNAAASETVDPTGSGSGNRYFDTELCHENFSGLSLSNPGANVPCTVTAPASSVRFVASLAPQTGTAAALPYKWVRITLKTNNATAPFCPNNACSTTPNAQVCWNGASEELLPPGTGSCNGIGDSSVYLLTALAVTPRGTRRMTQMEVTSGVIQPAGAINAEASNAAPSFNNGFPSGTGDRIPPTTVDGRASDINGNLLPVGSSCSSVAPLATDADQSSTQLASAADNLTQNIVTRANDFCTATGTSPNPGHVCTPGLWWVRGTNTNPRFTNTSNSCSVSDPTCYKNLSLSSPELDAVSATSALNLPDVTLPSPTPLAPFIGAAGSASTYINQVASSKMQQQISALNAFVAANGATTITSNTLNGGTYSYGSLSNPSIVVASGALDIKGGATFTGYGILVVPNNLRIEDAVFNWTGIVLVQPPSGEFRLDTGSSGTINGALYVTAQANGTVNLRTSDSPGNSFRISYSCDAVSLALSKTPWTAIARRELSY